MFFLCMRDFVIGVFCKGREPAIIKSFSHSESSFSIFFPASITCSFTTSEHDAYSLLEGALTSLQVLLSLILCRRMSKRFSKLIFSNK